MCYPEQTISVTQEERRILSWLIESTLSWSELPLYVHEGETLRGFLEKVRPGKEVSG